MDGKVILGIDPGTNRTGYGIVRSEGNALHLVVLGDIDLHRIGDPYRKLQHIFERVCQLIDTYRPDEAALESPFFGANVQSMLKLGRAQGVAMAAALSRGLPVSEYAPRRVKQAITGRGSASKEQVASLLKSTTSVSLPELAAYRLMPSCPFAVAVMGISLVNFSRFTPGPLAGASIFSTVPETPNSVLSTSAFRPLHSSIMSEGWSNTSRSRSS